MGASASLYVGPYAMWVDASPPTETDGEVMFRVALCGHWGPDEEGEIEPGQGAVPVVFFSPNNEESPRSDGPKRAVRYSGFPSGGCAGLDLRDIDQEAEVEAFRLAYQQELEAMAERIGRPPVLRWGVIYDYN